MDIQKGYLFITDITGYTRFLTQSELDHAKEILDAIFDSILEHLNPPIIISGTQGDAIVCYFPEEAFIQSQSIIEEMEHIYYDFRHQLSLMKLNTTCTCKACVNMALLDLKIFLHYGQYMLQQIGDKVDLQGTDVILIHRLMKNAVKDKFGWSGYGLITEAAVDAIGITGLTENMHEHTEQVEHFDDARMFIYNLNQAWEAQWERDRQVVTREEALAWAEIFVPVPQWVAWDVSLNHEFKRRFLGLDVHTRLDNPEARMAPGAKYHCVHNINDLDSIVLDMDAPNYITSRNTNTVLGLSYPITLSFRPVEGGTMFAVLYGMPDVEISEENVAEYRTSAEFTANSFTEIIEEEIAAGRVQPEQLEEIAGKKGEHLRPGVDQGRFASLAGKNI